MRDEKFRERICKWKWKNVCKLLDKIAYNEKTIQTKDTK